MNLVVCVKLTPDPEDIEVQSNGSISLERAEWSISNFDLQAVEAGVHLVEMQGGKVTVLSAGPRRIDNSRLKKDLLSRGPDELVMIADDGMAVADTAMTASILAQAIRRIGGVDLVLCGEGSADLYFQQVGLQVGEKLGWPCLNAISSITMDGEKLVVERRLEEEIEVLEVVLPAVLSVTTDIAPPRLPSLKEILKAGKKPVTSWTLADLNLEKDLAPEVEVLSVQAPPHMQRKKVMIPGGPEEAAQALAAYLRKEGVA